MKKQYETAQQAYQRFIASFDLNAAAARFEVNRLLNCPKPLLIKIIIPRLDTTQEHIVYYLAQLETASQEEAKGIKTKLKKLGY